MVRRVILGVAALAVMLVPAASASAGMVQGRAVQVVHHRRANSTSTNWSGYATFASGTTFTDAKGTWVQPTSTCPTTKKQYSSFWVGIDGYNSGTVEQTGTDADCTGTNRSSYYAWYEFFPNPSFKITSVTIHPGDTISAEVLANGTSFTVTLTNVTTGATFSTTQSVSSALKTSAEWVAEAPSSCFIRCTVLPLANFGTVNFSGSFTTGNGHTGSINDAAWSNDAITMVNSHGVTKALPSALSADGQSFSVTWMHS